MSNRYVNVEQFKELVKGDDYTPRDPDEQLVVLAPQTPTVRALGGPDSRLVEFIITDESVDRMSDVIHVDGWETDDYEKNPVVLWAHSHFDPPVGKAITLDVLKKQKQVRSITEFTPKELNPLGYMVYQMYVQRFMHAVSVGFIPKEYAWVSSDSDAERARRGGVDFLKQSLLEYSAVPVPANPNALAVARSAGIDTAPLKAWAERVLDESSSRHLTDAQRKRCEVLRTAASPAGRSLILELGDVREQTDSVAVVFDPHAADDDVAFNSDGTVTMSERTLNDAIQAGVDAQLMRVTGRIPDPPARSLPGADVPIYLTDDELTELVTEALRQGINDAFNKMLGRVD